jgi:hypothetical protein
MGDGTGHEARVSTAMLTAAISGTVMHPLVARLDDEVLRSQPQRLAEPILPAMKYEAQGVSVGNPNLRSLPAVLFRTELFGV